MVHPKFLIRVDFEVTLMKYQISKSSLKINSNSFIKAKIFPMNAFFMNNMVACTLYVYGVQNIVLKRYGIILRCHNDRFLKSYERMQQASNFTTWQFLD